MSGNDVVRSFTQLTDAEVDQGTGALLAALGAQPDAKMQRRLGLRRDGAWCLAVRSLNRPVDPTHLSDHRNELHGLWAPTIVSTFHPLAEALALIESGAEGEAEQFEKRLVDQHAENEREEKKQLEKDRKDRLARNEAEREFKLLCEKYDQDAWVKTTAWAQSLLWQAIVWAPTHPEQASRLRELARPGVRRAGFVGEHGFMPFPAQPWKP